MPCRTAAHLAAAVFCSAIFDSTQRLFCSTNRRTSSSGIPYGALTVTRPPQTVKARVRRRERIRVYSILLKPHFCGNNLLAPVFDPFDDKLSVSRLLPVKFEDIIFVRLPDIMDLKRLQAASAQFFD